MNAIIEQINQIGKTFIDFALPMLIQSSVLIIILLAIDLLLRKKVRAIFRYWIWMIILVKLMLPPTLSLPTTPAYWFGQEIKNQEIQEPEVQIPEESPTYTFGNLEIASPSHDFNPTDYEPKPASIYEEPIEAPVIVPKVSLSWQGLVFVSWLLITFIMLILLIQRTFFVKWLINQSHIVDEKLNNTLEKARLQIGLKKQIALRLSDIALSPSVCGLFNPTILIPKKIIKEINSNDLKAILLHELAHIKRHDLWVNLFQTILQILYIYNPLLWIANFVIRNVREQAVDEMVLVAMGENAEQYPRTLLNISRLSFGSYSLSLRLIGVAESKKALFSRIKHITSKPFPKTVKLGITGLTTIVIAAFILLPMAKAQRETEVDNKISGWSETVNGLRWRISLSSDKIVIGKPIKVDMEFQNVSDKPLRILKEPTVRDNLYPTLYTSDGNRDMYPIAHEDKDNVDLDKTALIEPGDIYKASWSKMTTKQTGPAKIIISYFSPQNTNPEVSNFWSGNLKPQENQFTIVTEDGTRLSKRPRSLPMPPTNNSARSQFSEELGKENQELANKAYSELESLCAGGQETVKLIEQQLNLDNIGTGPFPSGTNEWEIARNIRVLELIGSDTAKKLLVKIAEDTRGKWPALFANESINRLANQPTGPMIEKSGVNRGIPIYDGFLFLDGKYIPAPYVVERWGVDIYINGVLVDRGNNNILGIDIINENKKRKENFLKSGNVIFDRTNGGEMNTGKQRGIDLIVSLLSGSTNTNTGRLNRDATFTAGFQSHQQLIQRLIHLGVSLPDEVLKQTNDKEIESEENYNEVAEFIKRDGQWGNVRYSETRKLITKDKLPILYKLFDDDEYALYWHKVVVAIGYASDGTESIDVLLKYIQRNDNSKVDMHSIMGKSSAFVMIGLIGGDTADAIIRKSVTKEGAKEFTKDWINEGPLPLPSSLGSEWLITMIQQHSLYGLVFSGKKENLALVEKMYNEQKEISLSNHKNTDLMSALISVMAEKDYIADIGLETYLNEYGSGIDTGALSPYLERYRFPLNEEDSATEFGYEFIEISGVIKDTSGNPIANAQVALSNNEIGVLFKNGKLENGRYGDKSRITKTDSQGKFNLGKRPAGEFHLIAAHDKGFSIAEFNDLSVIYDIQLEPWGRIEGQVAQSRIVTENNIWMSSLPNTTWFVNQRDYQYETRCDMNGRFVFEKVPPGWFEVGYLIQINNSPSASMTSRTPVQVKAGEMSKMTLGGEGRPVTGKFVAPQGYNKTVSFLECVTSLQTVSPEQPRPDNYEQMTDEQKQQWYNQWRKSDQYQAYIDEYWHDENWRCYSFFINDDGSFRIEDVIPGKYKFYVTLLKESGIERKEYGGYGGTIEVPQSQENNSDEPFDLGKLELKMYDLIEENSATPLTEINTKDIYGQSPREPNDKEIELFESILRTRYGEKEDDGETYYLANKLNENWLEGNVKDFPDSFYKKISDIPIKFKKASKAQYNSDNRLFIKDPETGKNANIVWITVNSWISDIEAEVEVGWRYGPLSSTITTAVYIKVDGKWEIKKYLSVRRS